MEEKFLKLKKKERKRLEKLVWKKARQCTTAPYETVLSLENALRWLEVNYPISKRSRDASK